MPSSTSRSLKEPALLRKVPRVSIAAAVFYQWIKEDSPNVYDSPPDTFAHYQPFDIAEPFSDQFTVSSLTANYDLDWMRITSASSYLIRQSVTHQDSSEQTQNVLALPAFSIVDGGFGAVPPQYFGALARSGASAKIRGITACGSASPFAS